MRGEVFGVNVDGFGFSYVVGGDSCVVGVVGFLVGVEDYVVVVRVVCPVAVEFVLLLWAVVVECFHGVRLGPRGGGCVQSLPSSGRGRVPRYGGGSVLGRWR